MATLVDILRLGQPIIRLLPKSHVIFTSSFFCILYTNEPSGRKMQLEEYSEFLSDLPPGHVGDVECRVFPAMISSRGYQQHPINDTPLITVKLNMLEHLL